jgi:hypothetical protein
MRKRWPPLLAALITLICPSCARTPVTGNSGVRLVVTVKFAGPINDNYQYFFLIRNGADGPIGQNGPIAKLYPPYDNGFATSYRTTTAGFTDFVEYSRSQRQTTASGYAVYHLPNGILGNPDGNVFVVRGEPDVTTSPNGGYYLHFELALSRIAPDTGAGETDPNNGATPRYLQINFVATTTTPTDPQNVDPNKYVDAFGDQSQLGSGFITIDCSQIGTVYHSSTSAADQYYEPEDDVWPSTKDPAVDISAWTIQVTQQ